MAKKRICASCRNGGSDSDECVAEFFVKGRVPADNNSGWRPYQAYLCDCHLEIMLDDGAEFHIQRKL